MSIQNRSYLKDIQKKPVFQPESSEQLSEEQIKILEESLKKKLKSEQFPKAVKFHLLFLGK